MPPEANDDAAERLLRNRSDIISYWAGFWIVTYSGIALAGGLFGLFAGGIAGLIAGPPIAIAFATPIIAVSAVVMWAFWLSRFSPIVAAVAGALTGAVSTARVWDPIFSLDYISSIVLAACLGGVVPGYLANAYRRKRQEFLRAAGGEPIGAWQYSLRDLFLRFTIVTVLIALIAVLLVPRRKAETAPATSPVTTPSGNP